MGRRYERTTQRRIGALSRVYASLLRPELFHDDYYDFEHALSPKQAAKLIGGAFERNYVDELGPRAAAALLATTSRRYFATRHGLRALLVTTLPTLIVVHGLRTGLLLQTVLYLASRPLAWTNRGRGGRCADTIARSLPANNPATAARIRRTLARHLDSIPAGAVLSDRWGERIVELLPAEEASREIAVKLADQYQGSIEDLVETSRALAR